MSIGRRSKRQVQKVRDDVFKRDAHQCVATLTVHGSSCAGELTVQHRVSRGMGSSGRFDAPNYLLGMCAYHNYLDAADSVFRKTCLEYGWSVPRWVANREMMSRVPVYYGDAWYLLDAFYRFEISESAALDLMSEVYGG